MKLATTPMTERQRIPGELPRARRGKAFAASLALASALLSQSADAEEPLIKGFDAVRACSGAIEKLCSGVEPGGGRIKAYIQGKVSELSTPCKEALAVFIASGETTDNTLEGCDGAEGISDHDLIKSATICPETRECC